jgi:hypothetical protein
LLNILLTTAFYSMAELQQRRRLRESRLRPWLTNSVISKLSTPPSPSRAAKVKQVAPTPNSVPASLPEEELTEALESLSCGVRRSWLPRRCPGCKISAVSSSEDGVESGQGRDIPVRLLVAEKQTGSTRIPLTKKLAEKVRGWLKVDRPVPLGCLGQGVALSGPGVVTTEGSLRSCLKKPIKYDSGLLRLRKVWRIKYGKGVIPEPRTIKSVRWTDELDPPLRLVTWQEEDSSDEEEWLGDQKAEMPEATVRGSEIIQGDIDTKQDQKCNVC